jgi:hypothetical protein
MNHPRRIFVATIVLGALSFVMFVLERLAIIDIFHGETDLRLEWNVVHLAFLPVLLFHVLGIVSAVIAVRRLGRSDRGAA